MSNTSEHKNNKEQDSELIKSFVAGNEDAFNELVNLHSLKAFQIAFGFIGNKMDAEEIIQDAFVKVYRNLDKFRGDSSFSTWLYQIVTNLSRNKYHWHRRRGANVNISMSAKYDSDDKTQLDMDIPDKSFEPSQALENKETGMNLNNAIQQLPEKLKEVIVLRHVEDMTYAEMAKMLQCELGTVKSRLSRARDALKIEFAQVNG